MHLIRRLGFVACLFLCASSSAQTINAAYRKALYQRYPTQKTDFCAGCKLWINPYYRSIADTARHVPLLTYYIYTKENRLKQEAENIDRDGQFAVWNSAYGQPNENDAYEEINREIGSPGKAQSINRGHCQPWILLAYTKDGAILSNTYTFNAAVEYQGQNLGTEIASEDTCRALTGWNGHKVITDSIQVWCGTWGVQKTHVKDGLTMAVPAYYYKLIRYTVLATGQMEFYGWWMPNRPEEDGSRLTLRRKTAAELVGLLGFDPSLIFN